MKRLLVCTTLLAVAATLTAQQTPPKSPPATETATFGGKAITITYSSPRVNGRASHIFTKDGLISHDKTYPIWRAGANAATILQTDADLDVGDPSVRLPKGSYSLYVDISDPDNWVLIVNKQTGQGGLTYDAAQDLVRAKMAMDTPTAPIENLKYTLVPFGGSSSNIVKLTLSWENHNASILMFVK